MRVLITGGAGYIGSHTARLLSGSGVECVLLDDLRTGRRDQARWGTLIEGSVEDAALVRRTLRTYGVTTVLHLAASAQAAESVTMPLAYFSNNFSATLVLLEAMAAENVSQLVFASTCAVYGQSALAGEEEPVAPFSPYGESKVMAERAIEWATRALGLRCMTLRYFNVAGAADGLGERCASSTRIVPRAVYAALAGGSPLRIFGTNLSTPDGSAVRDYVHVEDVARANQQALQALQRGIGSQVINIGSGRGTSVFDIVAAVSAETGQEPPSTVEQAREGDPACVVADIRRAHAVLDWQPASSDLPKIVRSVVRSCRSQQSASA